MNARRILLSAGFLLAFAAPASAQSGVTCCAAGFTPEAARENGAHRRAFEAVQADSRECRQQHIGCPEEYFTQAPGEAGRNGETYYDVEHAATKQKMSGAADIADPVTK
jgi:hypothetical protein